MQNKDAYIEHLENTIKDLQNQIKNLTEMLSLLRKEKFASSSEKTSKKQFEGQLSLFNEAELEADARVSEPIETAVKGHRRKNCKTKRDELLKDLPVREVLCSLVEEDQYCEQCNTKLKVLGKKVVREELEYIPAKLRIVRYIQLVYECPKCKHTTHPYIVKAHTPSSLMNHSLASPSSVANVMYKKYVNGMPLYRQEKDWEQLGISLTRSTMANWIIRCSEDYLKPIVEYLHKRLLERDILHCDETPVQVLKEEGKAPQAKSYMWLYKTGNDGKPSIIIYDYQPSRNGDHAVKFLKDFRGYVHCDGYSGYNKLSDITRCGCWAHLRRKFIEAIPSQKVKDAPLTHAEIGRDYCNRLFYIEDSLKNLTYKERYYKRPELEKPVLEAFWSWIDSITALKGSALGKAIIYAKNQRPYLENYLLDGRCAISNNTAENAIRPFTVGRKNWLFSDTSKGASASAIVYSIVETAKANGLNAYTYLEYLLMYMPDTEWQSDPDLLEDLMPWSMDVQEECKL